MENNFTWNKWSERKPEEGQSVIVVIKDQLFKGSLSFRFMGGAIISHVEFGIEDILDNTYWIEWPE